jgi:hypothetical protein
MFFRLKIPKSKLVALVGRPCSQKEMVSDCLLYERNFEIKSEILFSILLSEISQSDTTKLLNPDDLTTSHVINTPFFAPAISIWK